ncbi:fibronectin type III domain-containing protein [Stutzerimonas zhaodongensis]|uniref:fibronectin type III domain-containing protein n=1 Tax=Stutzerimonas TaxID=2901164 RepID=UPI00388E4AFA
MYHHRLLAALAVATATSSLFTLPAWAESTTRVNSPGAPYAASSLADRIVLTPGANPSTEMGVAFRTDLNQPTAQLQLGPALAGPTLDAKANILTGETQRLDAENGPAYYHQVRLTNLQPDTAYVYRVKGAAGWSEWLQFHTAKERFAPFNFIYLGDTQNDILSIASRTTRQALRSTANPALIVHAGDLVAQGSTLSHDDEWGEWNQVGGYAYGGIPQLPAAGNHEYLDDKRADGSETRRLGPHFPLQFTLPDNGAEGVKETSYVVDYQGVRFVVLDGTAALDLGALETQTEWLERNLRDSKARWNIVVVHQPLYTCARPGDTEPLKGAWKPLLDRYGVDMVLQGHDHCYSRLTDEAGRDASAKARAANAPIGPVYMVSVVGSKAYGLNGRARQQGDRIAEQTQLYQTIAVEENRLAVRTFTADGSLYDAFDIERDGQGKKRLRESESPLPPERFCEGAQGPDGLPCIARDKSM